MGDYDELSRKLREKGLDAEADELEGLMNATDLRRQAKGTGDLQAELDRLKAENKRLVQSPLKTEALRRANVDLGALRPAELQMIQGLEFEGDVPSEDWVAKVVSEYQLPIASGGQASVEQPPNAAGVVQAAQGAPAGGPSIGGTLSPATVAEWTTQEQVAFAEKNPEAWEQLKAGEEVTGVTIS